MILDRAQQGEVGAADACGEHPQQRLARLRHRPVELDERRTPRRRQPVGAHAVLVSRSGMDPAAPMGEFIRRQRELQALSMRQLADLVGISNPYLSQIERGLREPSEKVLGAIAENLQLSAEALRAHGRQADDAAEEPPVVAAIRADPRLTARQRQALLEVYRAFAGR